MFYNDDLYGLDTKEETKKFMGMVLDDLKQYYSSVDGVLELAEFMARFSNYSARNMQVIKSQFPNAYACANLKTFKAAGFSLKDGEKEIKVFHPLIKEYVRDPETKKEVLVKDLTVEQEEQVKKGDLKVKKNITYYLKNSALDISQTNANIEDLKRIFPNRQFDFEVSEENKDMLIAGIQAVAEKEKIESKVLGDNASHLEINKISEVIHELVREKIQGRKGRENEDIPTMEFETQLTSHIVCNHYGMDPNENIVPYISKWIQNGKNLEEKDSSIIRIHETARTFINTIDQKISELQKEIEKEIQKEQPGMNTYKESAKSQSNPEEAIAEKHTINDKKEQMKFELPASQQKILKSIQEKAQRSVSENIGLDLGNHWSYVSRQAELNSKRRLGNYKIQLSEDGQFIEDIQPNMILSLGELHTIVNKFGTKEETKNLEVITKELEPYYEADLLEKELFNTPIAQVSVDHQKNMKVECISEYMNENHENFDFNHSVSKAIDSINHSIKESHKEVMNGDIECKGLYQESTPEKLNEKRIYIMNDHFEQLKEIQEKVGQKIDENVGINLEKHWEEYEIQLSEDGQNVESIYPDMRLSLGDMSTIVAQFGTEEECEKINAIEEYLEPFYQADLIQGEFMDTPIIKVSTDRQQNMVIECVSDYVKDSDLDFDFNNSVGHTINAINSSIEETHKEIMKTDIEYKGLYPISEDEVVYCEISGKPLEQDEEAYYQEALGFCSTAAFESCNSPLTSKDVQNGELGGLVKESEVNADTTKEYVNENKWLSKELLLEKGEAKEFNLNPKGDREQARKQHILQQMHGRDY
uniref:hypothetical protein n=1 Tax=Bacillus multifaciens TaxID=3068506 RepID=UPI003F49495C